MSGVKRVRWLADFLIDYGSIVLVGLFGSIYLWGSLIEPIYNPPRYRDGLGLAVLFGVAFMALAVKLWRDVRTERRRER